ncbi:cytochrome c biogenesis CcdA family protein [Gracilimonas sp.]|uniref:cytochrome c biogenesis CcdA family protein n=1 Tax=Gracilimonas sp. TaxID=1974203 RepID=UPI00287239FD|nr:cytochrome c biogenesis CcdA family protein [Gracilimonas sp.]
MEFIYFSFLQGVVAFFAPCAVALLPGYIVSYISRNSQNQPEFKARLYRGLKLAGISILGILVVYALAGILIIVASQILKAYMKWVTIGMGVVLIILGILMIAGKNVAFSVNINQRNQNSETKEAFVFGIGYAIGALGCLFPLFLAVATQALTAPSIILGGSYILAYFVGISLMMVTAILLSTFAKDFFMKYLRKLLPHMGKITGSLLILAGIYVIYYQMILI